MNKKFFLRESILAIFIGLYGLYTLGTGFLILVNNRKILDPAKYIQIGLIKLGGNYEKAENYEKRLKEEKNWPQYGKYVIAFGVGCILISWLMWTRVH